MQSIDVKLSDSPRPGRDEETLLPYSFRDNELLGRQQLYESNARTYPRRIPLALKRGKGIYVEDIEGRIFIDCLAVAGTLALGHNHPAVVDAIQRALRDEVPMQTLDLTTPIKDEFVHELFSLLPEELARNGKIQFCGPTGSDAVEAALKLVRTATGRDTILAFHGAYHGMTHGSLSLMGNLAPKQAIRGSMANVHFLPYPYAYRCPFGLGGEAGERVGIEYITNVLNDPESGILKPAGIILEAVQGEGGVIPASSSWLRKLRALTQTLGIPLIVDEVQTGLGRTGRIFAFEHAGIVPDVVVLSKAIGGGLPLSVVVYRASLDTWQPGAHAGTFRGNQLGMAGGAAAMRYIRAERLDMHAAELGSRFQHQLEELQQSHPEIGDVRGRGLMIGMEIVNPAVEPDRHGRPPQDRTRALAIQAACLRRGLIVELGGREGSTLRFLPPLIITQDQLDVVLGIVAEAVRESTNDAGTRNARAVASPV